MDITRLSATRIKSWLECKYKYGCIYHNFHPEILKDNPIYFKLGIAVHEALEYAGNIILSDKVTCFEDLDMTKIINEYYNQVAVLGLDDLEVVNDGVTMLTVKLRKFEYNYPILSLEEKFETEIEGVPITGAMDRVIELEPGHVCVIDYKTSKHALTDNEMLNDLQVGTYDIVTRQKYPEAKEVSVCLDYLRLAPKRIVIPKGKRESNIRLMKSVYRAIKEADKKDLKPTMHEFCPWCNYSSVCPAVRKAEEQIDKDSIDFCDDLDKLSDIQFKARTLSKQYSLLKDKIDSKIKEVMKDTKSSSISTDNYDISMRQNVYVKYNIHDVLSVLGVDRLIKCSTVNRNMFEKEAVKVGVSKEVLNEMREINYSKPILTVKPIKK